MSNHLPSNLKSLIGLPVGTRIILKSSGATRIYAVMREDKIEVKVTDLENNAQEYMKKAALFDLYQDGTASFFYPNQSWEAKADANKRDIEDIFRNLTLAEQNTVRLMHEACKQMHRAADAKGRVPKAYVAKLSEELRKQHPTVQGLSRSSLYRRYKDWVRAGGHIAAILPRHHSKGNRRSPFGVEVLELFEKFMNDHYLQRNAPDAVEVHGAFKMEIERINKRRGDDFKLKVPSIDAFRRWINKLDAYEVALKRHGEAVARKLHGYAGALEKPMRPMQTVEVDHTPIDLQLLSKITGIPCGRVWLTILVDVYSRMIVGLHMSFDPPSYVSVAKALEHAMRVKPKYEGTKHDWICHGRIERLLVDNGPEFHSEDFEANCALLNVIIEYTPRRKPWRKPHVERLFREINRLFHNMPASTFSNYIAKGDFNPDRRAYATIEDVNKALVRWVVDVYHQRPHRGIHAIPEQKYLSGIQAYPVSLPSKLEDLTIILGQTDHRIVHEYGVEFRTVKFKGDAVASIRSHPDYREDKKLEIRYSESDCTKIHVKHPAGHYVVLENEHAEEYAGMNFYQMQLIRRHAWKALNLQADRAGIAAAKEDIRRRLGWYDNRKRRLSRSETRVDYGLAKNHEAANPNPQPPKPKRHTNLPRQAPTNAWAKQTRDAAWGHRVKNCNGGH
jgi:putative transposase